MCPVHITGSELDSSKGDQEVVLKGREKTNSMNHLSVSLHLETTVLHTVIMNVLHAEFHQQVQKMRKELRKSSLVGSPPGRSDSRPRNSSEPGRDSLIVGLWVRHHWGKEGNTGLQVHFIRVTMLPQNSY